MVPLTWEMGRAWLSSDCSLLEDLGEQVEHGAPGALVGPSIVFDRRIAAVGGGLGEAMDGTPVEVHPPVDPARPHLLLKGETLLGRDDWILGTDAHEDLGDDVRGI